MASPFSTFKLSFQIAIVAILLTSILNRAVDAQSATATLSGVVTDASGAAASGAVVTIVNAGMSLQRKTATNDDGYFIVAQLPPNVYMVTVEAKGFAIAELRDVTLNVNDQKSLSIMLTIAEIGVTVTVKDAASLDESPAVATVVDRQFIENQPLNGRSFQSLITLAPGVVLTKGGVGTQGQFSVNGQRASTNYFTVDGVSANFGTNSTATLYEQAGGGAPAYSAFGSTNALASVDAVQEFKIQTSTYAPEFGREPGAQVQIVTRTGTNVFHGSAFEYFRNDVFDANDFFANRNRQPKAALRQNDFGFVLGGPLFLPRLGEGGPALYDGRNHTFFFLSYEGLRLRQPQASAPAPTPSLAARAAATGAARDLLNAFPVPNGPSLTNDPNLASFAAGFSNPSSLNAGSVRIDHEFRDRLTVFGRFNYAPSDTLTKGFGTSAFESLTNTFTSGATMIFTPRLTNDLRINFSKARTDSRYELSGFGGAIPPPDSSLFPSYTNSREGFSGVFIGSMSYLQGFNAKNQQRQFNLVNTLSYSRGPHALKFGVDYRRLNPSTEGPLYRRFLFYDNVAQVISGNIPSGNASFTDVIFYPRYQNFSAFTQDTWRASRRLTLTYGLRYEINPSPTEKNDNLPYTATGLDDLSNLRLNPKGTRFYRTTYNNVAPRVGAAYALSQAAGRETILRGGFGVFYDLGYTFTGSAFFTTAYPYGRTINFSNLPLTSPLLQATAPPFNPNPGPPYQRLYAYADNYKLPYTLQYNFAIEQSLGSTSAVTISYVGASGRRLGRVASFRNPAPGFTRIDAVSNDAESNYNALQLQYQRRLARGFQVVASYTFSKSLDTVSDESITNFQAPAGRLDPKQDYGPSTFDVRQAASGAVSYELPSPFTNGIGRRIFGDFAIDSVFTARSAVPINLMTGTDPSGFGVATVTRPDLILGQSLYLNDPNEPGGRRLNRAAFAVPPAGRQGTLGRNALRGFPLTQLDLSLRRRFQLTEGFHIQFRIDAFNILNHPNFADPVSALNDPNFGRSTQMVGRSLHGGYGFSPLYQVGGPRSLQFALKLQF